MANSNVRKSGIPKKRHSQQNETTNAFHYFEALYAILAWNGGTVDDQKISGRNLEFLRRSFQAFQERAGKCGSKLFWRVEDVRQTSFATRCCIAVC
jgi:hypothetical protein